MYPVALIRISIMYGCHVRAVLYLIQPGVVLQDNFILYYFGGHDTSAYSLVHLLYELALDERVLEKVRAEQAEVGFSLRKLVR
jgi:hypothetical protein